VRNTRKRRDREVPCVKHRRLNRGSVSASSGRKKNAVHGLANYTPEMPVSEDTASLEKSRLILLKEEKRLIKDRKTINQLMQSTFYDRRHRIMQGQAMAKLKDDYPSLFSAEQVILFNCWDIASVLKIVD